MNLFFIRHGQAGQHAIDSQRALTHIGEADVARCGELAATHVTAVQHIFVSPYVRAQQTCEIFMRAANLQARVTTVDWLTPEASVKSVLDGLLLAQQDVLLVSHQPLAGDLLACLSNTPCALGFVDTANLVALEGVTIARDIMSPWLRIDRQGVRAL